MTEIVEEEARPDVDAALREYFQGEMPRPWPRFRAPRAQPTMSVWTRYGGRMALAACIALMAAGYIGLAGYFPRMQPSTGVHEIEHIGQNPHGKNHTEKPRAVPMENR